MLEKAILNDFLNHFYTPNQLAIFLNEPVSEIERILNDEELITSILGKNGVSKVRKHRDRIDSWIYSSSAKEEVIETQSDRETVEIANYIVINKASIRKAADHFGLSKSYVYDRVEERLPIISIVLYKKVFDVLKGNKSLSVTESISKIDLVNYEYDLLEKGHTLKEIADILGLSYSRVQRDLADRLGSFDSKLGKETRKKLFVNQFVPLINNQFDSKKLTQFMTYEELVSYECDLVNNGYTLNEIATMLGLSYSKVQRDVSDGSKSINPILAQDIKDKLLEHKLSGKKVSN